MALPASDEGYRDAVKYQLSLHRKRCGGAALTDGEARAALARYEENERRMANVATVWRQATPWLFYPLSSAHVGHFGRGYLANPAWTMFRAYGWRNGINNYKRFPHLERGMFLDVRWSHELSRWIREDTGQPVKHLV